jgi:hypothetical protein
MRNMREIGKVTGRYLEKHEREDEDWTGISQATVHTVIRLRVTQKATNFLN